VSCRLGTFVVFIALALRMREKRRAHADREKLQRQNRKEMQGEQSPKTFSPRQLTIPASEGSDDGYPSNLTVESWLRHNRRSPSNRDVLQSKDHALLTHPVGRSSAPGSVVGDREPLLTV
jgi:hypothetical protein